LRVARHATAIVVERAIALTKGVALVCGVASLEHGSSVVALNAIAIQLVSVVFSNGGTAEARALARELGTVDLVEAVLAENGGAQGLGEVAESLRAAARKIRLGVNAQAQQEAAANARR